VRTLAPLAGVVVACLANVSVPALSHSGRLNSQGCHANRNTGEHHCHGGSSRLNQDISRWGASGGAFRNCDAARAAGAAPVYRGDPGYGPHLDRDNDGVGCEPYRGR
jgi:hypothetical protein